MKEARTITIVFIILAIITIISTIVLSNTLPGLYDYIGIATNIICGVIVGLVTSVCQYCTQKRKIINEVYNSYFAVYMTYYYTKEKPLLFHYSSYNVYKKLIEMNSKITAALDEYYGILKKEDRIYKRLNPKVELDNKYKIKNIKKSIFKLNNKKSFEETIGQIVFDIENMLKDINKKRFEKDKKQMIKIHNYMYDIYFIY